MLSWCCDAPEWLDESYICGACKEHCDFYDEDVCDHDFIPVNNDGKHECRFCKEIETDN